MFFSSEHKHDYTFDPQLQSGYFPFQSEQAKGYAVPDLKEFFHLYPWSALPAGMSDRTWHLFTQLRQLAEQLLGWIETESPPAVETAVDDAPECHDSGQPRNPDASPPLPTLVRPSSTGVSSRCRP